MLISFQTRDTGTEVQTTMHAGYLPIAYALRAQKGGSNRCTAFLRFELCYRLSSMQRSALYTRHDILFSQANFGVVDCYRGKDSGESVGQGDRA